MRNLACCLILVMQIAGCTNQQLYEAARQNSLQACDKWEGAERARCESEYQMPYRQYEQQRHEVVGKKSEGRN